MKTLAISMVVATLGITACADSGNGTGDAPVGVYNDSPTYIVNEPDQFANISFRCMGPNGLYVTTRDAPPLVVPNDPLCEEGGFWDHLNLAHNPDKNVRPNGGDK
jgi:hypothetical protein